MMSAEIVAVNSSTEFKTAVEDSSLDKIAVVHFWAEWAPQCKQVNDVLEELAKDSEFKDCIFAKVLAEEVVDLSEKYKITSVPTVLFFKSCQLSDRLEGANIPELTKKLKLQLAKLALNPVFTIHSPQQDDLNVRLKKLINAAPCILFMKGTPEEAHCGFSKQVIALLNKYNARFSSFNVFADEKVREGLKKFSNWPTYPQLYIDGKLVGGIDILKELDENGELEAMLPKKENVNQRLEKLVQQAPVMVFMKGSPQVPRCGFSRTLVQMLNETEVPYETFDILEDDAVRQGMKEFSKWPTFPQVYVNGSFVGGLDILKELQENDELVKTLKGEQ